MPIVSLIKNNIEILSQSKRVLESLSENQYIECSSELFSSSIGKHTRHILDHYVCFLNGLTTGYVDYDDRCRDPLIEKVPAKATVLIDTICSRLNTLKEKLVEGVGFQGLSMEKLRVHCSTTTTITLKSDVDSSVTRELVFLHGHSVHHHAMIRIMLIHQNIPENENLGIAPSTNQYEQYMEANLTTASVRVA